jgi:hypothetical protein
MRKSNALKIAAGLKDRFQVIRDRKGAPEYVLVPYADFNKLIAGDDEDAALIAAGNAARQDEAFPADVARRLIAGETPLKVIREWRRLTQDALARKTGLPAQYISQLESRYRGRNVGRKAAAKLAGALKVSSEVLIEL